MIGGTLKVGIRNRREETQTAAPYSVALFPVKEQFSIRMWLVKFPLVVVPPSMVAHINQVVICYTMHFTNFGALSKLILFTCIGGYMRAHTLTPLGTFVCVHTYSLQYGSWLYAYTRTYSLGCTCALIARRLHTCMHTHLHCMAWELYTYMYTYVLPGRRCHLQTQHCFE